LKADRCGVVRVRFFVCPAHVQAGLLKPVVDRSYPLSASAEAIAYVRDGHATGKVVIEVVAPYSYSG
jgi:hypothetical protein